MIEERCRLWGFDGDLAGNEDRIFARLPIIKVASTNELAAADTLYWSSAQKEGLTFFPDDIVAAESGTRIPSEDLLISPGHYVVLLGPDFIAKLNFLDILLPLRPEAEFAGGWMVSILNDADYEDVCNSLLAYAREVFDAELRTGRDGLSRRAEGALTLLRANPLTPLDIQQTRSLAASLIRRDPEGFHTTLQLSGLRLAVPSATLLERLHEYLTFIGRDEAVPGLTASHRSTDIADELQERLRAGPDPFNEHNDPKAYVAALIRQYQETVPAENLCAAIDHLFNLWDLETAASEAYSAYLFTLFVTFPTNEGFVAIVSYLGKAAEMQRRETGQALQWANRLLAHTLLLLIGSEKALRSVQARKGRVTEMLWNRFLDAVWLLLPFGELGVHGYELLLQHVSRALPQLVLDVLSNENASQEQIKELFLLRFDHRFWIETLEQCLQGVLASDYPDQTRFRLYELVVPDANTLSTESAKAFYLLSEAVVDFDIEELLGEVEDSFPEPVLG